MNLFDKLVTEALKNQPNLSPLRIVVEKELLHHDILRVLSNNGLLSNLTFTQDSLSTMGKVLFENLNNKYGLLVQVSEAVKDKQNVDTWKIKVETRPQQKNLQRINIDICAVPSYERRPMMLLNPYGVDMGTSGLLIQAQSREEIYADKLLAFAFRPNHIKYRDLWDMIWLHIQGIKSNLELISNKLQDRNYTIDCFLNLFDERKRLLIENSRIALEFKHEMKRFLPIDQIEKTLEQENFWDFVRYLIEDLCNQIQKNISK